MFRIAVGVITGYLVTAIFVIVTFSLAWVILGSSFVFVPGTTSVTAGWLALTFALSFAGAVLGGFVASTLGRHPRNRSVHVLAGILLVVGLATAVLHLASPPPRLIKPPAGLTAFEAAGYATQPPWFDFVIPIVGALGVILGGSLFRRSGAATVQRSNPS